MRHAWLALALPLAGCAATPKPAPEPAGRPAAQAPAGKASPTRARPPRGPARTATPLALPGLEGVIGADAAALVRLLGPPRLDALEGDARKLQWSGTACVLDAYLYPPGPGREPVTTYVDARRPSDAQDVDRAACVAALRQR